MLYYNPKVNYRTEVTRLLRLKEARERKNVKQSELARLIGVSQAAICKFETGEINPSLETLVKISLALECPLDELVDKEALSSVS